MAQMQVMEGLLQLRKRGATIRIFAPASSQDRRRSIHVREEGPQRSRKRPHLSSLDGAWDVLPDIVWTLSTT